MLPDSVISTKSLFSKVIIELYLNLHKSCNEIRKYKTKNTTLVTVSKSNRKKYIIN
jgi:hypothetical protein